MNDDQKEALRLAGIMADAAGGLVGESFNFGGSRGCSVFHISKQAEIIKEAVKNYNEHMLKMSMKP